MRMRSVGRISKIMIAVVLLAGCGARDRQKTSERPEQSSAVELTEDREDDTQAEVTPADENSKIREESGNQQTDAVTVEETQNRLEEKRILEDQSFQVELNDWGEVRFVSYRPDYAASANPLEDVSFYLLKNEEIVYQFPYLESDHTSGYGAWSGVKFVMFMDTNDDGKTDIVIGPEYCTGAGPQGAIPHVAVRIYEDCGDSFTYKEELSSEINDFLPWESNVQAKDIRRLLTLVKGNEPLTDYESYTGEWREAAGYTAAYEEPELSKNKLACVIRNGNEFAGNLFAEQDITERVASVENITGIITDGELFYEFTDDGWGGTGTLHITFLANQIHVEVLNYQMAEENASGYGISGSYEMTIRE